MTPDKPRPFTGGQRIPFVIHGAHPAPWGALIVRSAMMHDHDRESYGVRLRIAIEAITTAPGYADAVHRWISTPYGVVWGEGDYLGYIISQARCIERMAHTALRGTDPARKQARTDLSTLANGGSDGSRTVLSVFPEWRYLHPPGTHYPGYAAEPLPERFRVREHAREVAPGVFHHGDRADAPDTIDPADLPPLPDYPDPDRD